MLFTALVLNLIHLGAAMTTQELRALDEVGTYLTAPESPGPEQVAQALSEGTGSVIVTGGDDTQRLVTGALTGTGVPLGTLATDTTRVRSRNLGFPRGLAGAALAITGVPRSMDLRWASLDSGPPEPFLVTIGMRRNTETFLGIRNNLEKRLGWVVYVRAGLGTIGRHRLSLRINGRPIEAWTVLAGSAGRVPMASLFPGACPDDGGLYVVHLGVDG